MGKEIKPHIIEDREYTQEEIENMITENNTGEEGSLFDVNPYAPPTQWDLVADTNEGSIWRDSEGNIRKNF